MPVITVAVAITLPIDPHENMKSQVENALEIIGMEADSMREALEDWFEDVEVELDTKYDDNTGLILNDGTPNE